MPRRRTTPARVAAQHLLAAEVALPRASALSRDPIRFPRAYDASADAEVVAVVSAMLAFGRVDLFLPVIARAVGHMERFGGPAAFVREFDAVRAATLADVTYRWNRPADFVLLFRTLRTVLNRHGSLGAVFVPGPAATSLGGAIETLRAFVPDDAPRSFRTWLPHPREGSACKRWLMLMRWMVRRDDVDLGLWTHLSPRDLVIPLDTHVSRIARFLGLTRRTDAGWRTAEEVTAALRELDPDDPVRFDFPLAHLGISGGCLGYREPTVCAGCPIDAVCRA